MKPPINASIRILVVDDQLENLELLNQLLTRKGFEVIEAQNSAKALDYLATNMVDLILLDVNMPDVSGYQVCAQIKKQDRFKDVPVIFVSAVEETNVKMKSFLAGGVDYITRPYQVKELLARIQTHLDLSSKQKREKTQHREEVKQLQEINHLKDEFLRMVSQDLKNPISIIMTHSDLLRMRDKAYWENDEQASAYLETIKTTAQRMGRVVEELIDVARLESEDITRQFVPIGDLLKSCLDEVAFLALQKQIKMIYNPPPPDFTLFLAPQLFSQVILNLLTNAIKYTDNNGSGEVELSTVIESNQVLFSVRDNGLGIPSEALGLVFNRFYRVNQPEHRQRSGSGLGLAIVKMILDQHNGTISVTSELGKGSTFVVTMPRIQ